MSTQTVSAAVETAAECEDVEIGGHIIDSLILPKILDCILAHGGTFRIKQITVGQGRHDPSYAVVEVRAGRPVALRHILDEIADHGAVPLATRDCRWLAADIAGALPEGFYCTTNQRTEVRPAGRWVPVERQEMDRGILLDLQSGSARCIPMNEVCLGDASVVGHAGVRVFPSEASAARRASPSWTAASRPRSPRGWRSARSPRAGAAQGMRRPHVVGGRPGHHPHRQRRISAP